MRLRPVRFWSYPPELIAKAIMPFADLLTARAVRLENGYQLRHFCLRADGSHSSLVWMRSGLDSRRRLRGSVVKRQGTRLQSAHRGFDSRPNLHAPDPDRIGTRLLSELFRFES